MGLGGAGAGGETEEEGKKLRGERTVTLSRATFPEEEEDIEGLKWRGSIVEELMKEAAADVEGSGVEADMEKEGEEEAEGGGREKSSRRPSRAGRELGAKRRRTFLPATWEEVKQGSRWDGGGPQPMGIPRAPRQRG